MLFGSLKKKIFNKSFIARIFHHKFSPSDFLPNEKLYRGFRKADIVEETGMLEGNSFTFGSTGGISFNWSRFSKPEDIRKRKNGRITDGCYSITVEQARYDGKVSTCHDPFPSSDPKNYAHTEIRQLKPDEDFNYEPPRDRGKLKKLSEGWSHSEMLSYREHISILRNIEFEALDE